MQSNTAPLPETEAHAPSAVSEASTATAAAAPSMSLQDCATELKSRFPALFTGPAKPLKLRIQADIQARAPGVFTKAALSAFLRRYTGGTGYLIALSKAQQRFDLDGQAAGELNEEHREAARQELARRRGLQQERQAEEDRQRQFRAQLLRDFSRTTLTLPNFCALKGIAPEALEPLLAQAREEALHAPAPARDDRRPTRHGDGRKDDRRDGRRGGHREARADGRPAPRGERGPRGTGRPGERPQQSRHQGAPSAPVQAAPQAPAQAELLAAAPLNPASASEGSAEA